MTLRCNKMTQIKGGRNNQKEKEDGEKGIRVLTMEV